MIVIYFWWIKVKVLEVFMQSGTSSLEITMKICPFYLLLRFFFSRVKINSFGYFKIEHEKSCFKNDFFTLLAGVCLSRFGDTTTSCPVWSEPTGVDCNRKYVWCYHKYETDKMRHIENKLVIYSLRGSCQKYNHLLNSRIATSRTETFELF